MRKGLYTRLSQHFKRGRPAFMIRSEALRGFGEDRERAPTLWDWVQPSGSLRQGGAFLGGRTLKTKVYVEWFAAVAFLIFAMVLLAGCAAGGNQAKETTGTPEGTKEQQGNTTPTVSLAKAIQLPKKFEADNTTPRFFKEALEKKKPLLVFFYTEGDSLSDSVRKSIKMIFEDSKYSEVLFLALNIQKPEHVFGLIEPLGVNYTPFISLLNDEGIIVKQFRGYVDLKTLEQSLYEVTRAKETTSTETL